MKIITSILNFFSFLLDTARKHPKFFFGFLLMLFIVLFFKQCQTNKNLEHKITELEVKLQNEQNRYTNNIRSLKDSVDYVEAEKLYIKGVLRVKEGELAVVSNRLNNAKGEIKKLLKKMGESEGQIRNIYITGVSSDITTTDVKTKVEVDRTGAFGLSVSDSNQIYSIETKTWFNLTPNGDSLKLNLLNRFDNQSVSQLKYKLKFSLLLSQIELDSGNTRVLVQARDINGNPIPKSLLDIPFINGVDFLDVKPRELPPPTTNKKRTGFGMMVGPSYGLYSTPNGFQPTWGIGLMLGYKLF